MLSHEHWEALNAQWNGMYVRVIAEGEYRGICGEVQRVSQDGKLWIMFEDGRLRTANVEQVEDHDPTIGDQQEWESYDAAQDGWWDARRAECIAQLDSLTAEQLRDAVGKALNAEEQHALIYLLGTILGYADSNNQLRRDGASAGTQEAQARLAEWAQGQRLRPKKTLTSAGQIADFVWKRIYGTSRAAPHWKSAFVAAYREYLQTNLSPQRRAV
jgi:hypothetical protein